MKRLALLIIFCIYSINCIEIPAKFSYLSKHEMETCTIICERTGNIDDESRTTAIFFENRKPQAKITYTLQGSRHTRPPVQYNGPVQYLNNFFLGRITNLERIDPDALQLGLYVLPAFAIHNLKELHKKQNIDDSIKDKNLYIDALLDAQAPYADMYERLFGFKKVDSGNLGDIYLLDPSNQEEFAFRCNNLLLPPSSITIEEKTDTKSETPEEIIIKKNVDEKYTNGRALQPKDSQRTASSSVVITPASDLSTSSPTAAATVNAAFHRLIRRAPGPQPKIRKSPRIKKSKCQSGTCPIHKKDLQ